MGEAVDGESTEFNVYEEAIAPLSDNLRAMMTGDMVEAVEGRVTWKHVSKQTFEQFYQFAMTGDYSIPEPEWREGDEESPPVIEYANADAEPEPEPELDLKEESPPGEDAPQEPESWDNWMAAKSVLRKKKSSKKRSAYKVFESLSYPLLAPRTNFLDTCEPSDVLLEHHNYSNVLLSHAYLYILADYRMVDELKTLALFKLHKTLLTFKLDSKSLGDIIDLVNCAYADEGQGSEGRDTGEGIGLLRDLVCHFLVTHTVTLTADERFMELVENGGDFAKDIWKYEVQRNHFA